MTALRFGFNLTADCATWRVGVLLCWCHGRPYVLLACGPVMIVGGWCK